MSQIIKETEKLKKLKAYGTITSKDTVTEIQPSILKKKEFIDSCIFCKKMFCGVYGQSNLKRHISAVHAGKNPFQCNYCKKKFAYKCNLKFHERIHTEEKPYSCQTCNKCFNDPSSLKKHELIHTDERRYSCLHCSKTFTQKAHLKRHQRVKTGEKQYSCKTQKKCFNDSKKKHELTHTGT